MRTRKQTILYFDACALIDAHQRPSEAVRQAIAALDQSIEAGQAIVVGSSLLLLEVGARNPQVWQRVFGGERGMLVAPTRKIIESAYALQQECLLRGQKMARAMDALHLATAKYARADCFITSDLSAGRVAAAEWFCEGLSVRTPESFGPDQATLPHLDDAAS